MCYQENLSLLSTNYLTDLILTMVISYITSKIMNQFCNLIERVKYNASLAITVAIKGTFRLKIYKEIRLQFLRLISKISKTVNRRLCVFYKIRTTQTPIYLYELISFENHAYDTRNLDHIELLYCRADLFKYSFFPYTI